MVRYSRSVVQVTRWLSARARGSALAALLAALLAPAALAGRLPAAAAPPAVNAAPPPEVDEWGRRQAPPVGPLHSVVRIASWNTLNLTKNQSVDPHVEVLADFDLIALQEVKSYDALERLRKAIQRETGVTWHKQYSSMVGDGQRSEIMAFLYRTDRVRAYKSVKGVYKPRRKKYFVRPPFYASFRAGKFDFTVVNYHARWGRSGAITEEVARMAKVYEDVQDKSKTEHDVIMVGDWNRSGPDHRAFDLLEEAGLVAAIDDPDAFTTYSTSPSKVGANFYDHIWYPSEFTESDFTGRAGVLYLHERYFLDDPAPHLRVRVEISDHCPVWAEFWTDRDDD